MIERKSGLSLYTRDGERKYLNAQERQRFLTVVDTFSRIERTFCLTLLYTGCRVSEALALTYKNFQFTPPVVMIVSLKKRKNKTDANAHVRVVPVPDSYLDLMELVHGLEHKQRQAKQQNELVWPMGRTTAWRIIKDVMAEAEITGVRASPKGLRHSFAVHAIDVGVPLPTVQKWLGHADIATTAIYTNIVGEEELQMARRMWNAG